MDASVKNYYLAIGKIQKCIANAETLDEAFQGSLRIIIENCNAEQAVIWYADKSDKDRLHPYYWISPLDMMSKAHSIGEGCVGRVYESQKTEFIGNFKENPDTCAEADFKGVEIGSMICVPFSNEYENLGCIQIITTAGNRTFTEEDADMCEIMVMMAAMAITENEDRLVPWHAGEVVISLSDICREFNNGEVITKVLKGVNLDIYKGEFLTLLGESGCGKSTLLNIIGGMDQATSGKFTYLGQDFSNATQEQLTEFRRSNVGFIFQGYNLMPNLNALQNLDLIGELVDDPMDSSEALDMVGLSQRKNNYPSQLSGGQQQRVSIARALVKKPQIILADEPTAALDYATSIEVLSVMEKIVESGATLIMVTHNEEISRMADRVVHMRDGRMYEVTVNRHRAKATDLVW
ncbi:MAG: ATP-binding cassette domain-containing protein [Firmicutes bacterium]|nr:ATP-binding cassette domain-containing protein [Bacillota bacterium]